MNETIIMSIDGRIGAGKAEALSKVLTRLAAHVSATEPATTYFTWYFSKDVQRCHVVEHYAGPKALLFHLRNCASFREEIDALRDVSRVTCCGPLPPSLAERFGDSGVHLFPTVACSSPGEVDSVH